MSFVNPNDHPNSDSPDDPLYYAPRAVRGMADPRSNAAPQMRSDHLPPGSPFSRFDEMREQAFVKSPIALEVQLAYERRPRRVLLATVSGIAAAIGVAVIAALVLLDVDSSSKTDPSRNSPFPFPPLRQATPAEVTSGDSQALLQGVLMPFQKVPAGETAGNRRFRAPTAGTVRNGAEKHRFCSINSCSGNDGNSVRKPRERPSPGRGSFQTVRSSEKGLMTHADGEARRPRRPQSASAARKTS